MAEAPRRGVRLSTPRLVLRPARPVDAVLHRRLWEERDARVPPHRRIGADDRPDEADLARWIETDRPAYGLGLLTIERRPDAEPIGYCGLIEGSAVPAGEPELAYELLIGCRGAGFATEAAARVLDWTADAGHPRLWATVRAWNSASLRVAAKLGFLGSGRVDRDDLHGDSIHLVRPLEPSRA